MRSTIADDGFMTIMYLTNRSSQNLARTGYACKSLDYASA